ncbi:MAG: hypothetical protein ACYS30_24450 [Planctomycetota bacterium]
MASRYSPKQQFQVVPELLQGDKMVGQMVATSIQTQPTLGGACSWDKGLKSLPKKDPLLNMNGALPSWSSSWARRKSRSRFYGYYEFSCGAPCHGAPDDYC